LRGWAFEARRTFLSHRFWYTRFDARGPHIFALFSTNPEHELALRAFLSKETDAFFRECREDQASENTDLYQRHRDCRGKVLCTADSEPGLAANNSAVFFRQEPDGYPFCLWSIVSNADRLWAELDALAFWSLSRVEQKNGAEDAIAWMAAVDRSLEQAGLPARDYWKYHAQSLIRFGEGPAVGRERRRATLQTAIGARNLRIFSSLWGMSNETALKFSARRVVELVASASGSNCPAWRTLREITHTLFGQLNHPVNVQIPMVLFAWQRSLSR
jgi:hypothetical protein